MASLIKNQIIKRLSKFVKNLSSNQINLSALKGEGELSSINLDEKALEDLIELPTWLKIQTATCGRAFIKIPWTNLKTIPIQIQLDDVLIEIETCEKLRDLHSPSNTNDPLLGKYGFTNRVIDGISLTITNITFAIKAQNFKASIFLPSLDIYSTTPNGKRVDNLTLTRLRNSTKDHILVFKEISWPNARIEASSNDNNQSGTAIRFIANSCRIGIAMKKNLQDSSLVTSRVIVHFDDLLSVVNDAQLKSALNTYKEITQLMKRASDQTKQTAGDKLIKLEQQPSSFQPKAPTGGPNDSIHTSASNQQLNDPFALYDIIETSLHFNIKRLDLHIVADVADRLVENGSVQMTIANLSFDHYPYHEFGSSRKHWLKYSENQSVNRNEWATKLYEEWQQQLNVAKASVPNDDVSSKFEKVLRTNRIRLFESCSVINIDDLIFYPVSLNNNKQQKRGRPIIASDKAFYQLPDSLGIIHIQHTEYYYPLPYAFPVPNSDLYIQIMPLIFRIDFATSTWLHAFISTLSVTIDNSGVLKTDKPPVDYEHVAIKLEAMLPRIVISSETFSGKFNDQKCEILELSVSKLLLTNTRVEPTSHRNKLQQHLELFRKNQFFQQTQWPFSTTTTGPATRLSSLFEKHSYETYLYDNPLSKKTSNLPQAQSASKALHTYYTMTTDSLKKSAKYDIWNFYADNIYLDFTPVSLDSDRLYKQNLTDTLSLTGWIVFDETEKNPWTNILGVLESPTIVKISQKQYTFIMHLVDEIGLFLNNLERITAQAESIKQKPANEKPPNNAKLTVCLTTSATFALAVIDGLKDETVNLLTPLPSGVPEAESEPVLRDTSDTNVVIDLITTPAPIIASTIKVEPSIPNKNLQRGVDVISKTSRGSSLSSSMTASDYGDETSSQLDMSEDLDADFDPSIFLNEMEQQQQQEKVTRIKLDDDSLSLTGKTYVSTASELINGVFVKLNQINICLTEDEEKTNKPLYIACEVKHLRIDEFRSLKFGTIKPKLFENESPDPFNNENVSPINIRIDLPKGQGPLLPTATLQIQNRSLATTTHALDILAQNLDEIFTPEQKIARRKQPPKILPLDIHLNNLQITLELLHEFSTTHAQVEVKPSTKVNIDYLHILRQSDGQVIIQNDKRELIPLLQQTISTTTNNNLSSEDLQQLETLRTENARLRSELNAHKTEISVLRGERDSLMNTISKLDIELTQAEYRRAAQQQQQQPRKK